MSDDVLRKEDMFRILKFILWGIFGGISLLIICVIAYALLFTTPVDSEAITIGGPGQANEEMIPGDLTVMNKATVVDLVASEEFETIQTGIDGLTTIPLTSLYISIESSGGDVSVTADPQIAAGAVSGDVLTLKGLSDINKIILQNGNGMLMSTPITIGLGDTFKFKWDAVNNLWTKSSGDTK